MTVSTSSAIAFATGMGALVGFVGMLADKQTQMIAFVGVAVAAYLFGHCQGALSAMSEAMRLITEHEKETAQQAQAMAGKEGAE